MPRRRATARTPTRTTELFETADASLLDVIDHVLNQGVVLSGDVTLGVANVDLIHLRLMALLCAADRVRTSPAVRSGGNRRRRR